MRLATRFVAWLIGYYYEQCPETLIGYTYTFVDGDGDIRDLPCVLWRSAEAARFAAAAAAAVATGIEDRVIEELEWTEDHDRRDGTYPTFVAKVNGGEYRVYPIEVLPPNNPTHDSDGAAQ